MLVLHMQEDVPVRGPGPVYRCTCGDAWLYVTSGVRRVMFPSIDRSLGVLRSHHEQRNGSVVGRVSYSLSTANSNDLRAGPDAMNKSTATLASTLCCWYRAAM